MKSRIKKIKDIDVLDYANIVVVRGEVKNVEWSLFPPNFVEGIVKGISKFFEKRFGAELLVLRRYSIILEDSSGRVRVVGLKGIRGESMEVGDEVIVCGVVMLKGEKPYLKLMSKKNIPNFLIRLTGLGDEEIEKNKKFFERVLQEFPEIKMKWKDLKFI